MSELIVVASFVAILFYHFFIKPYNYWKCRGVKQENPIWIFCDNWGIFFRVRSFTETIESIYRKYTATRYFGMYQFSLPTLVVKDPYLIKQMTIKDFDHFTDHRFITSNISNPLWAKNLVSLRGKKWREMRAVLSPSFTSNKLRTMFELITECAENFVEYFLEKDEDIVTVEVKDIFTRFTNDVIGTTAFGVKVDSLKEPNNEFYVKGKEATEFGGKWRALKFFGYLLFPKLYDRLKISISNDEVNSFFMDLINKVIKTREEEGIVRPDMIHLLMQARKVIQNKEESSSTATESATTQDSSTEKSMEITNVDIAAQAMTFFLAGFDTVSNLMCFMSYELAVNEDIQRNLRKEVVSTLEKCGGKLTYDGLLQMEYMDMVVSETLRKWPSTVMMDRVCTRPYTIEPLLPKEKPLYLDEGAALCIPIFAIHRDPKYFLNPERFDPERFSYRNKGFLRPYTYFPFGLGPRNCIGSRFALLETKTLFFHILLHFQIIPVEKTEILLKTSWKSFHTASKGRFWVGLKRVKS